MAEACVVGKADEHSGEVPLAFIVLTPAAAEYTIRDPNMSRHLRESIIKVSGFRFIGKDTSNRYLQHVEARKASYKRLTGGVQFIDNIPVRSTFRSRLQL